MELDCASLINQANDYISKQRRHSSKSLFYRYREHCNFYLRLSSKTEQSLIFKHSNSFWENLGMKQTKKKQVSKKTFPVWGWILIAIVVLGGLGFAVLQKPPTAAASLPTEITIDQAAQKRDQGAYILDVREPSEWTSFHIPGATLIPLGDLPNRVKEVPKDREVVVVCRTGHRSAQGRDILLNAGFTRVTSMAGGVTQWQAQGLPIATGQ
jgi:rhodanese-related sulfurtransferase